MTLSPRQYELALLVMCGKSNQECADAMRLTLGSVKEYMYHIFRKCGIRNRTELAIRMANQMKEEAR